MQDLKPTLEDKQYSTVNNNLNNSTVQFSTLISKLPDIIPDDGYLPFYKSQFERLGYKRFMELVSKARAGSDTPQKLFCWMLKNNELVK